MAINVIPSRYKLILGSKSPRRKQLLAEAGFDFEVRTKDTDESFPSSLDHSAVAEYVAKLKADAFDLADDEILITADSVVEANNQILGKPTSTEQAQQYLTWLSDTVHHVHTGVCIKTNVAFHSFTNTSHVTMHPISDTEKTYYIQQYNPYDKAGGYGIQDWIGHCKVKHIDGSYTNIMGLPMAALYKALTIFCKDINA